MIDNFQLIREHLDFSNPELFYFVQLQQRKKDDSTFPANNRTVKSFFISSLSEYDALEPEIKRLAKETNSRVYIRLNRRSFNTVTIKVIQDSAKMLEDSNFQHLKNLVPSCTGETNSEPIKTWVIDIDTKDKAEIYKIKDYIQCELLCPVLFEVPTLNGVHLITPKFDSLKFSKVFPEICIHKDNPTLLYYEH